MLGPRKNRWTWDDTFMAMAMDIAQRSPDPSTQVGCVLVSKDNILISAGYNGVARGINPDTIPWDKEGELGQTKYDWVAHAERNTIDNSTTSTKGAKCYVTLQPCNNCAIGIIQAGITEVIYLEDKYKNMWFTRLALDMFNRVDVKVRKHKWSKHYLNSK